MRRQGGRCGVKYRRGVGYGPKWRPNPGRGTGAVQRGLMAGAGEGGSRGVDASPDPTEPARAEEAATQALPMVRRTTFEARKPTVIRAVARRAAAALPELGREGGAQPIPRS